MEAQPQDARKRRRKRRRRAKPAAKEVEFEGAVWGDDYEAAEDERIARRRKLREAIAAKRNARLPTAAAAGKTRGEEDAAGDAMSHIEGMDPNLLQTLARQMGIPNVSKKMLAKAVERAGTAGIQKAIASKS